jgi:hypothetical protein
VKDIFAVGNHLVDVSILFHHYKELMECRKRAEEIKRRRKNIYTQEDLQKEEESAPLPAPQQLGLFDFSFK